MSRSKTALIHLAISSTALLTLTLLTLLVWYPYPHFQYEGVLNILMLIALVDVVIGPALTFLVVKTDKSMRELRTDLGIIALVQILAFGYGAWIIQSEHPEYLLYSGSEFRIIAASQVDIDQIRHDDLVQHFHAGPTLATFVRPDDPKALAELTFAMITEGKTPAEFPQYFEPYQPSARQLAQNTLDLQSLYRNSERQKAIGALLHNQGLEPTDVYFFPLVSYLQNSLLVLSRETAKPIGYLDLNPY